MRNPNRMVISRIYVFIIQFLTVKSGSVRPKFPNYYTFSSQMESSSYLVELRLPPTTQSEQGCSHFIKGFKFSSDLPRIIPSVCRPYFISLMRREPFQWVLLNSTLFLFSIPRAKSLRSGILPPTLLLREVCTNGDNPRACLEI